MMKNTYRNIIAVVFIAATIGVMAFLALSKTTDNSNFSLNNNKIIITTTTSHIHDLVKNIAGEHAEIYSLMGPGTDPHLYQPVRSDIIKMNKAHIVFYNGYHLEGQMNALFEQLSTRKPVIGLANSTSSLIRDNEGVYDPHIWMNVQNWKDAANMVSKELSAIMPEHQESFEKATASYVAELTELENYIKSSIATIPEQNRVLITAHDAFGYLGDAYGLEVVGIQGLSTASEAGLFEIEALVKRISDEKIPAVFTESSVSDQNIIAITQGVKSKGHSVINGGTLYSDALGNKGSGAETYIDMMHHNIKTITKALGGRVLKHSQYKEAELKLAQ